MESSLLSSQKLHRRTMFHENPNFLSSRSHNPKEVTTSNIPRILKDYHIQKKMKITAMKERSVTPAAVTTGIATIAPPLSSLSNANRGIGVVEFLHGKTYFITGGTGFLGKALIEKILRTVPHISKIFVLIKAKSEEEAMNRLKNDIIYSELFKCLRQMYGKKFEAFVLSKLVPVVGNVCEDGLGMDEACAREISQEADVFIHSAANTTFDQRANYFWWRNTYEFSKAMGEMMINSTREDVPVVILRPSVITSTYKYPFPGWVQGIKAQDPFFVLQGKGMLPGFLGNHGVVFDTIPVDMVVNAMLGAIAKHGSGEIKRDLIVYHVGSSTANPLLLGDMFRYSYNHFASWPLLDRRGEKIKIDELTFLDTIEKFTDYTRREIVKDKGSQWLERRCKKAVDHVVQLAMMYEPYMSYDGRFDNGNTQKLVEAMSHQELECFDCDVRRVDWEDYFCNVHMPGLRKHAMKERSAPKLVPSE